MNGSWLCDCAPTRLPAEHFKVKKEGKNQGRWFYTCQQAEPQRCGFFLWDDDAKPREEAAVLANSRNEPVTPSRPANYGQDSSPTPAKQANTGTKRTARQAYLDDDDDDQYFSS